MRRLLPKIDSLRLFVSKNLFDVIAVSLTWLKNNNNNNNKRRNRHFQLFYNSECKTATSYMVIVVPTNTMQKCCKFFENYETGYLQAHGDCREESDSATHLPNALNEEKRFANEHGKQQSHIVSVFFLTSFPQKVPKEHAEAPPSTSARQAKGVTISYTTVKQTL